MSGERLSNCCGVMAPLDDESDLCPNCMDHCEWTTECDKCEGKGYTDETCMACNGSGEGPADGTRCSACGGSGNSQEQCDKCDGTGEIELNHER